VGQVGINFSSFGEPASRFTSAIERSGNMEEGKIATLWAQFSACGHCGGHFQLLLVNQPVVLLVQLNERSGIWKKVR
jgi:hypothetical protein